MSAPSVTLQAHKIAESGVHGRASTLPHLPTVQSAFGAQHPLTNIQAYTGPAAQQACQMLGAEAYTLGNKIAFNHPQPSLATTIHETAHYVQQQSGLSLAGGFGQRGDVHEQHADQVANAAMQGKAVDSLLNKYQPSSQPAHPIVQMKFAGFDGKLGWAKGNPAFPGAFNNYVAGANNKPVTAGGAQQAGAQARQINVNHRDPATQPADLGGMAYFENALGKLAFKTNHGVRSTRMHVINGKFAPGTNVATNMSLGNATDNNHHRNQAEGPLEVSLLNFAFAGTYLAAIAANPPDYDDYANTNVLFWKNAAGGGGAVPGLQAIPGAPNVNLKNAIANATGAGQVMGGGGGLKFYVDLSSGVHTQKKGDAKNAGRWFHYKNDPQYTANAMPPTLRGIYNRVLAQAAIHAVKVSAGLAAGATAGVAAAPAAAGAAAISAQVTATATAAGATAPQIGAALGAIGGGAAVAFLAAKGVAAPAAEAATVAAFAQNAAGGTALQVAQAAEAAAIHFVTAANAAGVTAHIQLAKDYELWVSQAFPTSLKLDATVHRPSYDKNNPWFSRAEAQLNLPINGW